MHRRALLIAAVLLLAATAATAAPAAGQAHEHAGHSPYAGMEDRAVKALSAEEVAGLRAGDGLGFALAAELNGLPGPKHVLELSGELGLEEEQASAIRAIRDRMLAAARELGEEIVQAETHLDGMFARGRATAEDVRRITGHIGEMRGRLRAVHLTAHLEVTPILTAEQVVAYQRLRGYAPAGAPSSR